MSQTDTRARRPQNEALAVRPLTAEVRSETDSNELRRLRLNPALISIAGLSSSDDGYV